MSDCLSSTDKIKINFSIESIHGISMENTTKSESKVCFRLIFLRNTLKNMSDICYKNNLTNVQLVNLNLSKGILSLKENNERLEGRVRRIVSETGCTFKRLKGRKKFEYFAEKVYFIVFKHEVCTLKEIIESEREKYKKNSQSFVS